MWSIVLIDDDRQVLRSMKKAIPWEKLKAACAGEAMDGEEGLRLVEQTNPDIIISDIYMPVMNGLDMISELRSRGYKGKIIILSGYADFEYAIQALRLGVDDYLSKPVTVKTLEAVLNGAIHQLEEELAKEFEQEDLRKKLELYEPFVEKEWLKSLVTGTKTTGEIETFVLRHPQFTSKSHVVMGIEMVRTERVSKISDWNLFRFAVMNVIEEILQKQWTDSSYIQLHSNHAAILLRLPAEEAETQLLEQVRKIGKQIIQYVHQYLHIQLHIGLGQLKHDWIDIRLSTEEAFAALSAKSCPLSLDTEIYRYNSEEKPGQLSNKSMLRTVTFYQEMAEAVRQTQLRRARELISVFIKELAETEHTKPSYLQQIAAEVCTICKYALFETGIVMEDKTDLSEWRQEYSSIVNKDQLEQWLQGKMEWICSYGSMKDNVKHKQVMEFMLEYIHENYAQDITISNLSEKVYISRNYLSHIFRKATGETFNNYLTRVRMEKAKTLILEGKHLIYEVAEMVGYKNVPYFSTLFKKVIGVNPSELIKL
ncbi:response regulator [Paenibacillus alkaliterrae]|uniref:response regulator n=1 Tax=Paenibacillus alkaliterrae TaxID=320909 RepID=UPI001F1AEB51|nr:response regulator [Paenibacillus alkaliterrae]MCF2940898.1 response regulator [Paenibacillus alkaliterrae]